MGKPTPGPWSQSHRKKPNDMYSTEVYDAKGETIAEVSWYPTQEKNGYLTTAREDNARLLAAAPCMLEALQELIADITGSAVLMDHITLARFDRAVAAISKAEGQS